MTQIVHLDINRFRGISSLTFDFSPKTRLICLIGRGDSGKTTVLDAISAVLSPAWNIAFNDTDFYNCDLNQSIEISATIVNFPEFLLSENKYGLHLKAFDTEQEAIVDEVGAAGMSAPLIPAITVKLIVDDSLEPRWFVSSNSEQEDKRISASDRAALNCFSISDSIDKHFSWNKGNPLYALLRSLKSHDSVSEGKVVLTSLRDAKKAIDKHGFEDLNEATRLVELQAQQLGLDISTISTTLDFRDLSIRGERVSLHDNMIPFRQKGKGSKRLASLAIQSSLVRQGGVMLVDELEQGLEPDRVKQLARYLSEHDSGQVFVTTHSRDAIVEFGSAPLLFLLRHKVGDVVEKRRLDADNENLQKAVRACPEAFFAKKVIVCEGATEVGICRSLDKWRRRASKPQMAVRDCAYIDGTGSSLFSRAEEISKCMETAVL